ncbi:acyltransferase family protein [Demequina sp.]|uniref:acyltransferase family protein n=1 Tax=Demequina sp. TaxID=2050685 RepID=UPI0025D7B50C|nr:acyltransferase family protein [Demequina sp.]
MTTTAATRSKAGPTAGFRPEIQALRALAVLGVVLFHLWPGRLTGGYAGVDVFFVISGYLITSHLAREVTRTGRIALSRFWARRVRRLLPAALSVLVLTTAATYLWVPRSLWTQHLWEVIASATYWQNWRLTAEAVDYLGAENNPSSVEHYWSLSVEEQFYLLWPLLLVGALILARRLGVDNRRVFMVMLALVGAVGLTTSIWMTATNPAAAYFVTPTRVWEFAVGGLLAFAPAATARLGDRGRAATAWAGWAAIAVTFVLYTPRTPFPGWTALLPVLGTAAVIWAGSFERGVLARVTGWRPVQYTGDVSYSLYLWHWPFIVIVPYALDRPPSFLGNVAILVVCYVLAGLSKRFIEDPARDGALLRNRTGRTYAFAVVSMAVTVAFAAWGIVAAQGSLTDSEERTTELVGRTEGCFGAAAVLGGEQPCVDPELDGVLLPEPAAILEDTGDAYACYDQSPGASVQTCTYGSTAPDALKVALIGNSHAASLLPGLMDQLDTANWTLDTYLSRGCEWQAPRPDDAECAEHRQALQQAMEGGGYDLILVSERRSLTIPAGDPNPAAALHAQAWAPLLEQGVPIVAVADNPVMTDTSLDCIARADGFDSASECGVARSDGLGTSDHLPEAVELAGDGAYLVDYTDLYCDESWCPAVIGHVIAYRDRTHITATFSRTLAPFLVADVQDILASHAG